MILVIDLGNTRWKMGLVENGDIIRVSSYEYPISKNIIQKFIQHNYPEGTTLISVNPSMEELIPLEFLPNLYILNKKNVLLNIDYKSILGPDRIAAALGGVKKFGFPLIVIDAGSAITVDLVDSKGAYKGGTIFSGIRLQIDALNKFTGLIKDIKFTPYYDIPGDNTFNSVNGGVLFSIIGGIKEIIEKYREKELNAKLVITGGDGEIIKAHISGAFFEPNLTIIGGEFAYNAYYHK